MSQNNPELLMLRLIHQIIFMSSYIYVIIENDNFWEGKWLRKYKQLKQRTKIMNTGKQSLDSYRHSKKRANKISFLLLLQYNYIF